MKKLIIIFLFTNILLANVLTHNQIIFRLKKINADTTEYLMDKTFKQNGWKRIQGEVGNNGIDGLYIKKNVSGTVTDVLFGEAKYNNATLSNSLCGKQMSKNCLNSQIDNLMKKYPNDKQYPQIKQLLSNGSYRARLFRLKNDGNFLIPEIKLINHIGDIDVQKVRLRGNQNYKINKIKIDINNPKNSFETKFIENYKRGQTIGLMKKFNLSAIDSQIIIKKSSSLNTQNIREQINISKNMKNIVSDKFNKSLTINNSRNFIGNHLKVKTKKFWKKILSKSTRVIRRIK